MKQTGFRRLTYSEIIEKQKESRERNIERQKNRVQVAKNMYNLTKNFKEPKIKKRVVKYPTVLGIKGSRYTGLKGVLWTIFSQYTRKRDFILYFGRCVSCPGTLSDWKDGDAGHYVSVTRGNFWSLFYEKNVHLQCKKCNNPTWTPDASIPMAFEIDRRYGKGTADKIYKKSQEYSGSYSDLEYMREIELYKEKFAKL